MADGADGRPPVALSTAASAFQPSCSSPHDFGWPRFETRAALRRNAPWASYIHSIYGALPSNESTNYPLCVFDFWWIDKQKFDAAGITAPTPVVPKRVQLKFDDRTFNWTDGELFSRHTDWQCKHYSGFGIYHSDRPYVASNMWVEVTHHAGGQGSSGEGEGRWANMWFSYARGSGIWLWTGKHRLFDSHVHAARELCQLAGVGEAWTHTAVMGNDGFLAVCVRRAGLDTLSFRTSRQVNVNDTQGRACKALRDPVNVCPSVVSTEGTVSTWGLVGLLEISASMLAGKYPCGQREGGLLPRFRAGWRASRPCVCDNTSKWLNCDG